jgi:hypothetical protein
MFQSEVLIPAAAYDCRIPNVLLKISLLHQSYYKSFMSYGHYSWLTCGSGVFNCWNKAKLSKTKRGRKNQMLIKSEVIIPSPNFQFCF